MLEERDTKGLNGNEKIHKDFLKIKNIKKTNMLSSVSNHAHYTTEVGDKAYVRGSNIYHTLDFLLPSKEKNIPSVLFVQKRA